MYKIKFDFDKNKYYEKQFDDLSDVFRELNEQYAKGNLDVTQCIEVYKYDGTGKKLVVTGILDALPSAILWRLEG